GVVTIHHHRAAAQKDGGQPSSHENCTPSNLSGRMALGVQPPPRIEASGIRKGECMTRFWYTKRAKFGNQRGFTLIELMIVAAGPAPSCSERTTAYNAAIDGGLGTFTISAAGEGATVSAP